MHQSIPRLVELYIQSLFNRWEKAQTMGNSARFHIIYVILCFYIKSTKPGVSKFHTHF